MTKDGEVLRRARFPKRAEIGLDAGRDARCAYPTKDGGNEMLVYVKYVVSLQL